MKTYHCQFVCLNRYDDYDYGEINQLLDRSFKVYIKTVVCTPEKVTKRMYDSFWRQFKHSEKVCACATAASLVCNLPEIFKKNILGWLSWVPLGRQPPHGDRVKE